MKQKWLQRLPEATPPEERPADPTYELLYNKTTHAVLIGWPNDLRRRKALSLPVGNQGFCVFFAVYKQRDAGVVTDKDLANQLYKRAYNPSDPKVKRNIQRWVCFFNKECQAKSKEPGRPLVRRKGQYEIRVKVLVWPKEL